ncbi:MAG: CPBP family intramembrane glutamic endopeptidase [Verrucomicrobiota bacterium]
MKNPLVLLALTAAGLYVAKLWRDDMRSAQRGRPNANALPGASPASGLAILIATIGALIIVAIETAGEVALGLFAEQSKMTWAAALYSILGAAVIEEMIFRGWIVVEKRGRAALWAGIVGASVVFALIHPFLWEWEDQGFQLTLTAKGAFSTVMVFAASLWFYAARFGPWNPQRSLLPCFVAHAAKNAGVVAVKAATGYMGALW